AAGCRPWCWPSRAGWCGPREPVARLLSSAGTAVHSTVVPSADLELGAFTDAGPWVVEPDAMSWRQGLAQVRRDLHASLPQMVRARKLPPGAQVGTTIRHLGGALLLWYINVNERGGTEK